MNPFTTAPILALTIIGSIWLLTMIIATTYMVGTHKEGDDIVGMWAVTLLIMWFAVCVPCLASYGAIADDTLARQRAPEGSVLSFDTGAVDWSCEYGYIKEGLYYKVVKVEIDGDIYEIAIKK